MADLHIAKELTLPCGLVLPNRLAKAAMAEHMANGDALPTEKFHATYGEWADGGWGLVITGNIQVDPKYLGGGLDVTFKNSVARDEMLRAWKSWAQVCNRNGTPTIVQINHPGRQSPVGAGNRGFFDKNLAPSAISLNLGTGLVAQFITSLVFGRPKEMTTQDIQGVVAAFAESAKFVAEAGFAGIEIHAAHGYLLSQFLSEKSNQRTDEYGGSPAARAKIVVEIIRAIRAAVPKEFCVGIKLNSADHQSEEEELKGCVEQLKEITAAGVDFLEISGGNYENPTMATGTVQGEQPVSSRTAAREAFFLEFAKSIRHDFPNVLLMVTGGFRTRKAMEAAVANGDCDLVGIGRPAVLNPHLPKNTILNPEIKDEEANAYARKIQPSWLVSKIPVSFVGVGAETTWYGRQIRLMGNN